MNTKILEILERHPDWDVCFRYQPYRILVLHIQTPKHRLTKAIPLIEIASAKFDLIDHTLHNMEKELSVVKSE